MNNLKNLVLCIGTLSLVGCMDTATRLWNGPYYLSDKKDKAYDICLPERRANLPELYKAMEDPKAKVTAEEIRKYNDYLSQCLRRQGV